MIHVLGCSHHTTPVAIREKLAFTPKQVRETLEVFRLAWPGVEAVLLSTCNRIELYTASSAEADAVSLTQISPDFSGDATADGILYPDHAERIAFLAICRQLETGHVAPHLSDLPSEEAVQHLFTVASSLDSMVVGEPQILSQVKQAYSIAVEAGTAGSIMHSLFQTALRCGKRVAGETQLHQRRVSVPSVAVADFAGRIFERFDDKRVLIIGAGEMGEETLRYLQDAGAKQITVVNRSRSKAEALAERWGGRVRDWNELLDAVVDADLVISTTGASEPIVTQKTLAKKFAVRAQRPLFVLDLAMPRDFDPAIGKLDQVFLYAIDDLQQACGRNQQLRDRELPKVERIITEEAASFMSEWHHRVTAPVIRQLREDWQRPKEDELQRLFRKLPDLDVHAQEEVRQSFDRLVNKLLHVPMESLRDEAKRGTPYGLIRALARLFRIGPGTADGDNARADGGGCAMRPDCPRSGPGG
ncbi:MAG: glutamyl-tRNA reductase [Thermoguttaceae bacterium]|nr:glutamyl-tRNA reductase [Thermoguttaceae bacterium]